MSLKHGLLGLLTLRKSSGYDLSKLFEESLSYFWVANQSQIYRELDKMENMGWVTSTNVAQTERPNKRVYGITTAGKNELLAWLKDNDVEQLMTIRNPLLMKLFFSAKVDRNDVIQLLKNYRTACVTIMKDIDSQVAQVGEVNASLKNPPYWLYSTKFCVGYYKYIISWIDDTIKSLQELK